MNMTIHRSRARIFVPLFLFSLSTAASAQVVNPADAQRQETPMVDPSQVPTTTVTAERVSEYREEDLIGPYRQPDWTAHRRFPTTRIYVRPPGTFEFEYWRRPTIPRHGPTEIQTQYEFEVGLPGRFQVDMYMVSNQEGNEGPSEFDEQKFEVRWAFADWGKIAGNPTLYVELANKDLEADVMEYKLLLGDELTPGWHWGTNLVFEHEMGGEFENVYEITGGLSKVLTDEKTSLGGELKAALVDTEEDRGDYEQELLVGPSFQYRPLRNIHIDLAALLGIGTDSPDAQAFFVLGYEF